MNKEEVREKLHTDLQEFVNGLKPGKIELKDVVLDSSRKYFITAIKADKTHGDLKVFYKNHISDTEKKVDLYDFHSSEHLELFNLIKNHMVSNGL